MTNHSRNHRRLLPDYDKCQAYIADMHSAFRSGS